MSVHHNNPYIHIYNVRCARFTRALVPELSLHQPPSAALRADNPQPAHQQERSERRHRGGFLANMRRWRCE